MNAARNIRIIARGVILEAVRRREVYAVVGFCGLFVAATFTFDFFQLEGLSKFYREVTMLLMQTAAALTVIVLAVRQLPREFEFRTLYPLLARPITRGQFLLGKLAGVAGAAGFCLALFMAVYVAGTLFTGGDIPAALFAQYLYLQMVYLVLLACMCFLLSLMMNLDAAITLAVIFHFFSSVFMNVLDYLYPVASPASQGLMKALVYLIPQQVVFDLSDRTLHGDFWTPVSAGVLAAVTAYGLVFSAGFFALALRIFRRRSL